MDKVEKVWKELDNSKFMFTIERDRCEKINSLLIILIFYLFVGGQTKFSVSGLWKIILLLSFYQHFYKQTCQQLF